MKIAKLSGNELNELFHLVIDLEEVLRQYSHIEQSFNKDIQKSILALRNRAQKELDKRTLF